MAIYMFGSSFFYYISHLEGEEVLGFAKQPVDYFLGVDNDYHCPNHVNFSCPQIKFLVVQPNVVENVSMQQPLYGSNACSPLVFQNGLESKENIYVDGQWWIECCPPNFLVWCFAFQKTMGLKEKKYQLLQICKWNSYSMLLKVLGTISYQIIGATYALVFFQWFESLHW